MVFITAVGRHSETTPEPCTWLLQFSICHEEVTNKAGYPRLLNRILLITCWGVNLALLFLIILLGHSEVLRRGQGMVEVYPEVGQDASLILRDQGLLLGDGPSPRL